MWYAQKFCITITDILRSIHSIVFRSVGSGNVSHTSLRYTHAHTYTKHMHIQMYINILTCRYNMALLDIKNACKYATIDDCLETQAKKWCFDLFSCRVWKYVTCVYCFFFFIIGWRKKKHLTQQIAVIYIPFIRRNNWRSDSHSWRLQRFFVLFFILWGYFFHHLIFHVDIAFYFQLFFFNSFGFHLQLWPDSRFIRNSNV